MKLNLSRALLSSSLSLLALVTPAMAVFPFPLESDANRNILFGSWSGNGTIQPNVTPGTANDSTAAQILVEDFSGTGALTINNMGAGVLPGGSNARLLSNTSAIHTITLTGGTADLRLANSNGNDGGINLHNSVGLTGFSGVTSVSYKINFSQPIANRNGGPTDTARFPLGAGLAVINAGTRIGPDPTFADYNTTLTYNEISYSPTPSVPGSFTQAPIGIPLVQAGFNAPSSGATTFTSNGFTGLDQFLLVRGYDTDGDSAILDNVNETYISELTFTFQLDNGSAFPADALFVVSMDGQQYSGFQNAIPEPTSIVMSLVALSGVCLMRRRCA